MGAINHVNMQLKLIQESNAKSWILSSRSCDYTPVSHSMRGIGMHINNESGMVH